MRRTPRPRESSNANANISADVSWLLVPEADGGGGGVSRFLRREAERANAARAAALGPSANGVRSAQQFDALFGSTPSTIAKREDGIKLPANSTRMPHEISSQDERKYMCQHASDTVSHPRQHPWRSVILSHGCRRLSTEGYETLNAIQSTIFPMGIGSCENILGAPTGAGKTNIAMIAVLRALAPYVECGLIDVRDEDESEGQQQRRRNASGKVEAAAVSGTDRRRRSSTTVITYVNNSWWWHNTIYQIVFGFTRKQNLERKKINELQHRPQLVPPPPPPRHA
ncbi:hypothetical protein RI054_02g08330 [Pseudoscourfieldia marina]